VACDAAVSCRGAAQLSNDAREQSEGRLRYFDARTNRPAIGSESEDKRSQKGSGLQSNVDTAATGPLQGILSGAETMSDKLEMKVRSRADRVALARLRAHGPFIPCSWSVIGLVRDCPSIHRNVSKTASQSCDGSPRSPKYIPKSGTFGLIQYLI
jgi:hypothetical protein